MTADGSSADVVLPAPERLRTAREALLNRAQGRGKRARRAKQGSNDRRTSLAQAKLLSACVAQIDTDKTLRDSIVQSGWDDGWRILMRRIVLYARDKEAREATPSDA